MEKFDIEIYFQELFKSCDSKQKLKNRYNNILEILEICYEEEKEKFEND